MSPSPAKSDVTLIAERITNAVMEHRLPPGVKLAEERLAEAFKVSRTKIRHALTVLAKEGLVTLYPNRGAFVASPSTQDARDLFATRRLLEAEVVRSVIARATKADLRKLRAHITKESEARLANDRRAVIKLSGEFHMLLARIGGNRYISKLMDELCPLTCLIISLYDSPHTPACPEDEHIRIVEAIERQDEATATHLMLEHLQHVENELKLSPQDKVDIDWDRMFA